MGTPVVVVALDMRTSCIVHVTDMQHCYIDILYLFTPQQSSEKKSHSERFTESKSGQGQVTFLRTRIQVTVLQASGIQKDMQ